MNSIITIIESKIKNFKIGEDYKFVTEPGKKTYTIFNEELKKLFWELFPQLVEENIKNHAKKYDVDHPLISIGGRGEKDGLIFSIGETTAEKIHREKKEEKTKLIIKRSKEIKKRHMEQPSSPSPVNQHSLQSSNSPANKSTTIFWIIGGISTLTIGGVIYLTKKRK